VTTYAVSTWSLHRTLPSLPLLEVPDELRRRGFTAVQICHFDLPTRDASYLDELRSALSDAQIGLDAILVDDGDLTHPTDADGQEAWIAGWLETATALGAVRARVIAGKQTPTTERLTTSRERLIRLAGQHPDLRVVTENWLELMPSAAEVEAVLAPTDGRVGLLIDLGNWTGPGKYAELAAVARYAETCHAKCHFGGDGPDTADFTRSLQVLKDAGYDGPLAFVYDYTGDDASADEWGGLATELEIARRVFG
jgi:sugar phosphate isomerase/epimerase